MSINTKTPEDQEGLNKRLRSLKIDRVPEASPSAHIRPPKLLLLALAVLIVLAAMGYFYFFSAPKTISMAEVKLESGEGSQGDTVLSVSGYVVAHHKIAVGAKVMGRVAWIGVEKGDKVQQGQILVRLEDNDFRAQSDEARANLAAAQARLDQLRTGSRPQEKMKDRAGVLQAQATLTNAEAEYERTEKLYRAGVLSKAELDRATAQRDTARALVEAARQSSAMTDIGPRPEEIRAAAAQVRQMKAALDYADTQLANTEIKAPVSGTVLQRIVERGELVSPSAFGESGAHTSVVALADLNDLQIELDISQADFARLEMNQRAEIIPEAFPNLKYTGFIAEIAPEANRAKATVQIKVKVENPDEQLRPEMNARVNFLSDALTSHAKPAVRVLVPKAAVVRKDGNAFVFVVKGNRVEQRSIRLGDEAGEFYYVFEGLSGGESAATAGVEKLRDGDRVKINQ
ncbi:MAG TPA: efflux RND transporter periplasmic adaptor subunit [Blastocatellia bacterium]|jgi:HlyD family secretion protein|nr:efflux RND transporter periplasmic adaptor subunit [Blastocatellia bacterium]HAF21509.1 efflux RND transporter periplasmic adaptor subunit [Blastocatellia bacterium]